MQINFSVGLLLLTATFLSNPYSGFSQHKNQLSLSDAIQQGLNYNKHLVIGKAKIMEASAQVQAAKDAKLPGLSISSSYLRLTHANIDIQKNTNNNNPANASPSPNSALYGIANASLPLYTGGKLKYNMERVNLLQKASELDLETTREAVEYNVLLAYANVYITSKLINIIKENYGSSISRDSTLSRLEQNGIIARNDLLKAKLHTSELQIKLLEAKSNYELAIAQLNILLGRNENDSLEIDENFSTALPAILPYENYLSTAMQHRSDLQASDVRILAAGSGVKIAKAEAYPALALTGGYIAADIPGVLKITNAINIGLGLQYSLSSIWKKNTALITAKAVETETLASKDIINDNIKSALITDYRAYILSTQKIALYDQTLEQANENYRITKNKYDNNLSSVNDLLDADAYVTQSKINKTLATADEFIKYKKLLLTTGTLTF